MLQTLLATSCKSITEWPLVDPNARISVHSFLKFSCGWLQSWTHCKLDSPSLWWPLTPFVTVDWPSRGPQGMQWSEISVKLDVSSCLIRIVIWLTLWTLKDLFIIESIIRSWDHLTDWQHVLMEIACCNPDPLMRSHLSHSTRSHHQKVM